MSVDFSKISPLRQASNWALCQLVDVALLNHWDIDFSKIHSPPVGSFDPPLSRVKLEAWTNGAGLAGRSEVPLVNSITFGLAIGLLNRKIWGDRISLPLNPRISWAGFPVAVPPW